jgi:PIN domain nuclease of toxin-antitoxin system
LRLLLDTHALIWFLAGDARLRPRARAEIEADDAVVMVSAASAMEVTTKYRLGKLPEASAIVDDFESSMREFGFQGLHISIRHAQIAGSLRIAHKDPFDRLLIAQSLLEGLTLVSNEAAFDAAGVSRLW